VSSGESVQGNRMSELSFMESCSGRRPGGFRRASRRDGGHYRVEFADMRLPWESVRRLSPLSPGA